MNVLLCCEKLSETNCSSVVWWLSRLLGPGPMGFFNPSTHECRDTQMSERGLPPCCVFAIILYHFKLNTNVLQLVSHIQIRSLYSAVDSWILTSTFTRFSYGYLIIIKFKQPCGYQITTVTAAVNDESITNCYFVMYNIFHNSWEK